MRGALPRLGGVLGGATPELPKPRHPQRRRHFTGWTISFIGPTILKFILPPHESLPMSSHLPQIEIFPRADLHSTDLPASEFPPLNHLPTPATLILPPKSTRKPNPSTDPRSQFPHAGSKHLPAISTWSPPPLIAPRPLCLLPHQTQRGEEQAFRDPNFFTSSTAISG